MGRFPQEAALRGSQKWLQVAVNQRPEVIDRVLARRIGLPDGDRLHWLSPLQDDAFGRISRRCIPDAARRDITEETLDVVLAERRSPMGWTSAFRMGDLVLVEAKAHIPEMWSPGTDGAGSSLELTVASLDETKAHCNGRSDADWSTAFYQYANRLAHLYLLRTLNDLPGHLAFIYFVGDADMGGPETEAEWTGAIRLMHAFLGLGQRRLKRYVHEVFIDIRDLA